MKIKLTSLAFLAIFAFSCKKNGGPLSCASDTLKYSNDLSTFIGNQTKGNCEAVKSSIDKLYRSCTTLAVTDKADYEEFQEEFDCNDYN